MKKHEPINILIVTSNVFHPPFVILGKTKEACKIALANEVFETVKEVVGAEVIRYNNDLLIKTFLEHYDAEIFEQEEFLHE